MAEADVLRNGAIDAAENVITKRTIDTSDW